MSSVRAVIVEAFPFSRIAVLWAEDRRWLALTRHAEGFETIALREEAWLTCELTVDGTGVVAVAPCDRPIDGSTPAEQLRRVLREVFFRTNADALRGALFMHAAPSVIEEPVVRLSHWQISELSRTGARHVWGYDLSAREGRKSSLLAAFDPATASLRSASGRRYELIGPPGWDADGEFVWRTSLSLYGLVTGDCVSVTNEVWDAIRSNRTSTPPSV